MQYLFTEEEYREMTDTVEAERLSLVKTINELCKIIADGVPIERKDSSEMAPFGCAYSCSGYCVGCPVEEVCLRPKQYGK